ncbi:hypothetical protein LV780_17125 [Cereibacter azotoformans]|uniref:hypothetical protein n=1 Tax=Cereibacter azotoformans TaxID=43057 RepID=UPI00195FB881|nr:hypothetical protein [Cereibacter azotoformans]UIJ32833.1 hypothetical protein LV780_17125 [Cereibacter azotoformans]
MRDLVRTRATAVRVAGKARQHLQGFLLRHGRIYPGKKGWTKAYRRWLTTVRFAHPAQQVVLQDHIHAVTDAEARIERLTRQIADLMPGWSLAPVVEAVQAMRGFGMGLGPCMDGSRVTRGSAIFGNWSGAAMYSASRLRFARAP